MPTITLTRTNVCPSGNHFTINVTGDVSHTANYSVEEFLAPVTPEEKDLFIKMLIKFAKVGRTKAQAVNALDAGYQVTI